MKNKAEALKCFENTCAGIKEHYGTIYLSEHNLVIDYTIQHIRELIITVYGQDMSSKLDQIILKYK